MLGWVNVGKMNALTRQKLPNTHCLFLEFLNLDKVRFLRGNNFFFLKPEVLPPYNVHIALI